MNMKDILKNLMVGVTVEDAAPSPCPSCDGSGFIKTFHEGRSDIRICPDCQRRREAAARMERSGISKENYERYTLETFKTDTEEAARMKAAAKHWLLHADGASIGYFGRPGTGKTHICIAICQASGRPHDYWQYRTQMQKLKNAAYRLPALYDELISAATTSPLLYIDDLCKGAMAGGSLSQQDAQILFEIVNARYQLSLQTIFSSEYSLESLIEADEGIGSRIAEMVGKYAISSEGKNRRLEVTW